MWKIVGEAEKGDVSAFIKQNAKPSKLREKKPQPTQKQKNEKKL